MMTILFIETYKTMNIIKHDDQIMRALE